MTSSPRRASRRDARAVCAASAARPPSGCGCFPLSHGLARQRCALGHPHSLMRPHSSMHPVICCLCLRLLVVCGSRLHLRLLAARAVPAAALGCQPSDTGWLAPGQSPAGAGTAGVVSVPGCLQPPCCSDTRHHSLVAGPQKLHSTASWLQKWATRPRPCGSVLCDLPSFPPLSGCRQREGSLGRRIGPEQWWAGAPRSACKQDAAQPAADTQLKPHSRSKHHGWRFLCPALQCDRPLLPAAPHRFIPACPPQGGVHPAAPVLQLDEAFMLANQIVHQALDHLQCSRSTLMEGGAAVCFSSQGAVDSSGASYTAGLCRRAAGPQDQAGPAAVMSSCQE